MVDGGTVARPWRRRRTRRARVATVDVQDQLLRERATGAPCAIYVLMSATD